MPTPPSRATSRCPPPAPDFRIQPIRPMNPKMKFTDEQIKAVATERNCSPARAVEILESAAWHQAVETGRQKSTEAQAVALAKKAPPAAPATPAAA